MKNITLFCALFLFILLSFFVSCKKHPETKKLKPIPISVTDVDGNIYNVVRVGDKLWMAENLRVTRYDTQSPRVNDTIFEATDIQGVNSNRPYRKDARHFVESPFTNELNTLNRSKLGLLYNWCAAAGTTTNISSVKDTVQGICPNGWRLPLPADFDTLCKHLDGKELAGKKLKSMQGWYLSSGTDNIEMNCYPAGLAIRNNVSFVGKQTMFWSSVTQYGNNTKAGVMRLYFEYDEAELISINKEQANSVRCILDIDDTFIKD